MHRLESKAIVVNLNLKEIEARMILGLGAESKDKREFQGILSRSEPKMLPEFKATREIIEMAKPQSLRASSKVKKLQVLFHKMDKVGPEVDRKGIEES